MIKALAARGIRSVITHPERHDTVRRRPEVVTPWLASGAVLQLTAGSLMGMFGKDAEVAAWRWLDNGQASIVATDAHDTDRRPPCMTRAIEAIERRCGAAVARRVCIENPARALQPANARAATAAPAATGGGVVPPRRRGWGSGVPRET
jgi:protein-tyrosine phosphatase